MAKRTKKKLGRPEKKDTMTQAVYVRFRNQDFLELQYRAARARLPIATVVRNAVLDSMVSTKK
jgi:hypothetical protein